MSEFKGLTPEQEECWKQTRDHLRMLQRQRGPRMTIDVSHDDEDGDGRMSIATTQAKRPRGVK